MSHLLLNNQVGHPSIGLYPGSFLGTYVYVYFNALFLLAPSSPYMSRSAPGSPPCASALHPLLVAQLSEAWRIDSDLLPTHLASLDHALRTHSAPRGALATSAGSRGVVPLLEPALAEISATYGRFEKAVGLHQDAAGSLLPLFRVDQRRCVVEWNCALQELTGIRCVCVRERERESDTG